MKYQNHRALLAVTAVLLSGSKIAVASPLVSIGDNTDIFFNGSSSVKSSSNVYQSENNEQSDTVLEFKPGFEVNVGRGASNLDLTLLTSYTIRRYASEDTLDSELFSTHLVGSYQGSRLELNGAAGFAETKSNVDAPGNNDHVESDITNLSVGGEYEFSPKFSFGAAIKYNEREYQSPFDTVLADNESVTLPFDLYYEATPKVDLSVGYEYTDREVGENLGAAAAYDQEIHFINVGARGQLLPKLNGSFRIGYKTADTDRNSTLTNGSDQNTLGLKADLTYNATPKLVTRLGLGRDIDASSSGTAIETTRINLSGTYVINSYFTALAGLSFQTREYDGQNDREDDQLGFNARLSYTPNEFWTVSGGYSLKDNDSDVVGLSYDESIFDLSVSLRY